MKQCKYDRCISLDKFKTPDINRPNNNWTKSTKALHPIPNTDSLAHSNQNMFKLNGKSKFVSPASKSKRQFKPKDYYQTNRVTKILNIFSINVGGLNTKLDLGIIDNVFNVNDVICLTETKLIYHDNVKFEHFKHTPMPIKNERHKFGGIHGISLFIRNNIFDNIEICPGTLSDCTLWVKLVVGHTNLQFFLGVVYIPHENSVYYSNDLFETLLLDIAHLKSNQDIPFLLIGDFNARTGLLNDFLHIEPTVTEVCGLESDIDIEGIFKVNGIPTLRFNEDLGVNKNGRHLIELCKATDLKILNGRVGKDRDIGKYTCFTGMGRSTIDYCLSSPSLIEHIVNFEIEDFDRAVSDAHCGINVGIIHSTSNRSIEPNHEQPHDENVISFSLKWDDDLQK